MFKDAYQRKYDAVTPAPAFRQELEGRIEEMQNKRKQGWVSRTAIVVLVAMLALTTVGFASGAFRSIFGSMTGVFQNGPTTDYEHMEAAADTNVFAQTVTFESGVNAQVSLEQSYYNGRQLATGWSLAVDDAKVEFLDRNDARVAAAEESALAINLEDKLGAEKAAEFLRRVEEEGWAGAAWFECYLSDSTYLAGLEKVVGDDGLEHAPDEALFLPETDIDWQEEGVILCYDEFETPLPEAAQNKDSLTVGRKAVCQQCWLIIDGDKVFAGRDSAERVELTFKIARSEEYAETAYEIEAQFPNHSAKISLIRTPIRAEFAVENQISDEWKAIWDGYSGYLHAPLNLEEDVVFDYEIWVDGEMTHYQTDSFRGAEGMSGWFFLPADAKEVVFRPVYANSGAQADEAAIIELQKKQWRRFM